MHLIGLDIGFSQKTRTNALAEIDGGELRVAKLNVQERDTELARLRDVDVIAIDAPLVPTGFPAHSPRTAEQIFCRGPFQKRCKPGASHVPGTGQMLRQHGSSSAAAVESASRWNGVAPPFPTVFGNCGIVEAFPNAFLGVALPEESYATAPKLRRGGKFDWLYDAWIDRDLFAGALTSTGLPIQLTETLRRERDHEKRAALVCLLTAAFAATGRAETIGDPTTGYFFLPPQDLWAPWARNAIRL